MGQTRVPNSTVVVFAFVACVLALGWPGSACAQELGPAAQRLVRQALDEDAPRATGGLDFELVEPDDPRVAVR